MNQKKVVEQFEVIINLFLRQGCSLESSLSFIYNNFDYVIKQKKKIVDNISFIYNNKNLYGVLIASGDIYGWSIYDNKQFYPIESSNKDNQENNSDYIVEMMLHFADTDKVKRIIPDIASMSVEGKVKTLKRLGLNSTGYHFR